MLCRLICLTIPFVVSSAVASAQVTLQQKYPEGSKFVTHSEQKSKQTLTLAGMDLDTKSTTFVVGTTTISNRAADGSLTIEEKVDSMQTEVSFPGGLTLSFDSSNPDKKAPIPDLEPLLEGLRAASRLPMTLELDAKNKIRRVKLPDGEFEKLPEAAKDRFNPETLQKASEQSTAFLPDTPVNVGDSWERSNDANMGEGQVLTFRTKFEYAGTITQDDMTLDKITGKVFEVSYAVNGNPMLQVKNSDLKVLESTGTYLFDRERGVMLSRSTKVQIAGPLTLVFNNAELKGKVDLTMEDSAVRQK
jgi:hypothetical protein